MSTSEPVDAIIERHAEALVARLISLHPSETVVLWIGGSARERSRIGPLSRGRGVGPDRSASPP